MRRKYITKQDDIKDCGAASISSIIKYYGGYVPLETLRIDTFTNKEGTTAFHIVNTLKKYGFQAYGIRYEENVNILKEKIVLPAIAHVLINNLQHFMVIYEINKEDNTLLVMDPASGYKTLTISEFLLIWTKVLIICEPQGKIPKCKESSSLTSWFIKIFWQEKTIVLKILLISLFLTITSIISSFFLQITLNNLNKSLSSYLIVFGSIIILKILLFYFRYYYETILNKNIDAKVIIPFLKHIFLIPLSYLKNKSTGEIVTRVKELNSIKNLFSKIFITIFLDLSLTILTFIVIYKINHLIFYLLLIILILYLFVSLLFTSKIKNNLELLIDSETEFNASLIENIDNIESIKNNYKGKEFIANIKNKFLNYLNNNFRLENIINQQNIVQNFVEEIGVFGILALGIFLVLNHELSILNLFTLNSLIIFSIIPFKNVADLLPEIYYVKTSFNKINSFLNINEENQNKSTKFVNGDIIIKNLKFSYDNYHYVLNNTNLTIKKGEHVMLNGDSGSGKSTLCNLLFKTYTSNEGKIVIGKKNIVNYNINTIRKNITYLSQKEKIFTGTIASNILFFNKVNQNYFNKIIKICRVDEILKSKHLGLETNLNAGEYTLSGGECQRIILARALLRNSKIIILDEALSEVEETMERLIIKDILFFFKNKTIIYITHRNQQNLFDRVINLTI